MTLRGYRLASRAAAPGLGERRSRLSGSGGEFLEFRAYEPGDELRRVDWNVYARTGKLFSKVFHAERAARVYAVTDTSASMGEKLEMARKTAKFLAGFARFDNFINREIPDLHTGLSRLALEKPGLVLLLSDGLEPLSGIRNGFSQLAARGFDLSFIQLLAKYDLAPPLGAWRVKDAETNAELEVDELERQKYLSRLQRHLEGLSSLTRNLGFRHTQLNLDASDAQVWAVLRGAGILERGA
jgi:uncharacterized protein (DUF58 family)